MTYSAKLSEQYQKLVADGHISPATETWQSDSFGLEYVPIRTEYGTSNLSEDRKIEHAELGGSTFGD